MATTFDIVIPVLNEERDLPPSTERLHDFLTQNMGGYEWRIVIADNGSTDRTLEICNELSQKYPRVGSVRLEQRGRGRALKKAWAESSADIVGYTDVDLSSDIEALPALVKAVESEGYEVAIASRLTKGSQVIGRSFKREVASRGYSALFRTMFFTGFHDAQCGFKVLSRRAADDVVPLVKDTGWFFDTELLIIAEKNGYRVKEIPVTWTEDPDTRVKIAKTAYEDIKGLLRLRFGGLRQASRQLPKR